MSDWWDFSACRDMPLDAFFPISDKAPPHPDAVAACDVCAVRPECLDWALDSRSDYGYFAGMTEDERRAERRRRQRRERAAEQVAS